MSPPRSSLDPAAAGASGSTGLLPDLRVNLPTTPLGALEYALACGVTIKPGANVVVVGTHRTARHHLS